MRTAFMRFKGAVPVLLIGAALFLWGCGGPKVAVEPLPVKEDPRILFSRAEESFHEGRYDQALEEYRLYLEKYPGAEQAGTALYRMARINDQLSRYKTALPLYLRLTRDFPAFSRRPDIQFRVAELYYRLGDYDRCKSTALEWLVKYREDPLRKNVFLLLAGCAQVLGNIPDTAFWWIKAAGVPGLSPDEKQSLAEKITGLIRESTLEDLQKMAEGAEGTPFAPHIYHRLAELFLEKRDLQNARKAAMALVRSTPEQSWVSLGRRILDRVEAELSVKPGAIGCLLPLSGPFAIYGQEVLNGILLGMNLFNDSGENQGIELIIKDTAGKPERAASMIQDLAERGKVIAVIGPLASKPALAAAGKAQELGVPLITLTQADDITSRGEMVFRNFLTPKKEVRRIVDKAVYELGMTHFGILYPETPYGRVLMNLFWDRVEALGGSIMAVESYDPRETDFAAQIKKMVGLYYPRPESVKRMLREKKALEGNEKNMEEEDGEKKEEPEPIVDFEAVFIPDNYQQVALIAPQFPFNNVFNIRFLGTSLWQSPELIDQAGEYIQGALFPTGFFPGEDDEKVEKFVTRYKTDFEAEPGILAATGYDTIRIVKQVLHETPIRTREDFRKGLLSSEGLDGLTGKIAFDPQGEVLKEPLLLTVSGKHFIVAP
ncbi:MAG: penicillin-binding protein activator [Deltaproteobacteria bacterium]|nr:penicillin-binding protein activator [Deltaproteobacteria bacterium]